MNPSNIDIIIPVQEFADGEVSQKVSRLIYYILRPSLERNCSQSDLMIEMISEGNSNIVLKVTCRKTGKKLIVKVCNRKMGIIDLNRARFVRSLVLATGVGNKVISYFKNGSVEEFFEGRTLKSNEISLLYYQKLIATKLYRMHSYSELVTSNYSKIENSIWKKCRDWLKTAFYQEERLIGKEGSEELKLCHNDLLPGNILYNEAKQTVEFIDFEFTDFSSRSFDIANHFNEYEYCRTGKEPSFSSVDRCQDQFLRFYVNAKYGDDCSSKKSLQEVARLKKSVKLYMPFSNLFWSLWGLIKTRNKKIDVKKTVDFMVYSERRYNMFCECKARDY